MRSALILCWRDGGSISCADSAEWALHYSHSSTSGLRSISRWGLLARDRAREAGLPTTLHSSANGSQTEETERGGIHGYAAEEVLSQNRCRTHRSGDNGTHRESTVRAFNPGVGGSSPSRPTTLASFLSHLGKMANSDIGGISCSSSLRCDLHTSQFRGAICSSGCGRSGQQVLGGIMFQNAQRELDLQIHQPAA